MDKALEPMAMAAVADQNTVADFMIRLCAKGLLISALLTGVFVRAQSSSALELFDQVSDVLKRDYINPRNLDLTAYFNSYRVDLERACATRPSCSYGMAEASIRRMIDGIGDAHLDYSSPTMPERRSRPGYPLNYAHLGLTPTSDGTVVAVFMIQPNSPADKAGVRVGDQITRVDSKATKASDIMKRLLESELHALPSALEILSPDRKKRTVRVIPTTSPDLPPWLRLIGDTAVLSVPTFEIADYSDDKLRTVMQTLHDLVRHASERHAARLVVDLRNNAGGNRYVAYSLACAFVDHLTRVYTDKQGAKDTVACSGASSTSVDYADEPEKTYEFNVTNPAQWTGPLAVLVSRYTMSAAENMTDVLQSSKRAVVVGEPTMGALGTAADGFEPLVNKGTLKFSRRRCTDVDGKPRGDRITPDILVPLNPKILAGGHDSQLETAISALK
jgi:carboxyl-terminal processing protease